MFRRRLPWVLIAVLACAAPSFSTTIIPLTFEQIVSRAGTAFLGETVHLRPDWRTTPTGKYIVTTVTFKVRRVLKGQLGPQVELTFPGGELGGLRMEVDDMPEFRLGDLDVLFLEPTRRVSPVVGFNNGRFRVTPDRRGEPARVLMHDGHPFTIDRLAAGSRSLLPRTAGAITYSAFEALVLQTIARSGGVPR